MSAPHPPLSILIIGTVWPEPGSSAAGWRMMGIIRVFREMGWEVTFATAAADSDHMADLSSVGVSRKHIALNDPGFDVFVKELHPHVVIFDRFMTEEQFGWRVAENSPGSLRVLDTEDLHCLRYARQNALKEGRNFSTSDLFSDTARREIASILRCDLSLIISDYEIELLKTVFRVDESLIHYLPFMLDPVPETSIEELRRYEERQHFISIGNFLHEPNWNSVLFLKEEIWPLIRKQLPEAELHVYGAYPSQKVLQLHDKRNGFIIKGRAENAEEVMGKARVCLAPIRFGAGLKGKLAEAMLQGTPSITSPLGAEGMQGNLPWSGTIAMDAEEFANAAVELYTDKNKWHQAQQNGFDILKKLFPRETHSKALIERILQVEKNLQDHRLRNFTGSMLMHQTMAATKYMSRWIEAKNKR